MAHVMIIEDEAAIVLVLQEVLLDEGYEISKAYDGITGFKILNETPQVDLVLVDLNMPGISGRSVIESMRSSERLRNVPVIIITGNVYNSNDFPPEGSYQAIIEKPFDLMELVSRVEKIISNNKAEIEHICM